MIISSKKIFSGTSGEESLPVAFQSSMMKVEVTEGTLQAYIQFDKNGDFWPISALNIKDYSQTLIVSSPGVYVYEISGIYAVKLSYEGTGEVSCKLIG